MTTERATFAMVKLDDGRVLAIGGIQLGNIPLRSAEIYDPETEQWVATSPMAHARYSHGAVKLRNGKVLVAGDASSAHTPTAELFDPTTETWKTVGSLAAWRSRSPMTLLADGRVLMAGGAGPNASKAETYDPASKTWTLGSGSMAEPRYRTSAARLGDGRVVFAGGEDSAGARPEAEVFDPNDGSWTRTDRMTEYRNGPTATAIEGGKVLLVGGGTATAEVFKPRQRR